MPRPRNERPANPLQSLDRALAALGLFTPIRPALSLTEVAERLGTGKSTAHRLLLTLEARGYITYSARTREYSLGLAAIRLGDTALSGLDLRGVAQPYLRRLAEQVEETAQLIVLDGSNAVLLDHADSVYPLRVAMQPGLPYPLHAGATNKVLLAHLPPERIEAYLSRPLLPVTGLTPIDPDYLREELGRIRATGYAWSIGEITPDVGAYAVPILEGDLLLGGLAVAGLHSRLREKPEAIELLKQAARGIVRELGSRV